LAYCNNVAGFSGHGFQLGPVIGEILDELVAEGRTPTPIEAFSITRFTAPSRGATQEAT
jgi:sarcosine oxidase subunit beta